MAIGNKSGGVSKKPGLKLEPYQVLIRPIISEKGTHQVERHNKYNFEVHPQATKPEIKNAVEQLFNVRVLDVCTQNRPGKRRRFKMRVGVTKGFRKAIVTLSENDRISLF